jgi:hypothetical protein
VSDLYGEDILEWSERQAALLHRLAAGELVNDAELDWPNIAGEIEDVGRSEQARRRFVPFMRQKIDVASLYADALAAIPDSQDGLPPLPIQSDVPTLEELLSEA